MPFVSIVMNRMNGGGSSAGLGKTKVRENVLTLKGADPRLPFSLISYAETRNLF